MTTIEEWRSVPSNELLEASNLGRVRSILYLGTMPGGGIRSYQMSPTFGYTVWPTPKYCRRQCTFKRKTYKMHQLIAEAFIGLRPKGLDVSHKDENGINNIPSNLEYVTRKVNLNKPGIKKYHSEMCPLKMQGIKTSNV